VGVAGGSAVAVLRTEVSFLSKRRKASARRELVEETGYEAEKLEKVCECYAMPGRSDEMMHVFFARELLQREQALDIGEMIDEVRPVRLEEVHAMMERGEIRDAKTLVRLFYALRRTAAGN
jgi:ADP-ribose pyrophosphatase